MPPYLKLLFAHNQITVAYHLISRKFTLKSVHIYGIFYNN